jgi:hypothetical protein
VIGIEAQGSCLTTYRPSWLRDSEVKQFDVFSDLELARQLKKTEARWRRGEIPDLRRAIDRLITFCYGTSA